ncbi:hypothetical protein BH20ACI3_BH20ACI3_02100 [soil metagenome]
MATGLARPVLFSNRGFARALARFYNDEGRIHRGEVQSRLAPRQRTRKVVKTKAQMRDIQRDLKLAVVEDPPPSINEICRRLGLELSSGDQLRRRFPNLMQKIISRRANRKNMIKKARLKKLATLIDADPDPPPSGRQVAAELGISSKMLARLSPENYRIIVNRRAYKSKSKQAKGQAQCAPQNNS